MGPNEPLTLGMFWGGLLVAAVPILFTLGVCLYLLRRWWAVRSDDSVRESLPE